MGQYTNIKSVMTVGYTRTLVWGFVQKLVFDSITSHTIQFD